MYVHAQVSEWECEWVMWVSEGVSRVSESEWVREWESEWVSEREWVWVSESEWVSVWVSRLVWSKLCVEAPPHSQPVLHPTKRLQRHERMHCWESLARHLRQVLHPYVQAQRSFQPQVVAEAWSGILRLPHKVKVNVTTYHACHAKWRWTICV